MNTNDTELKQAQTAKPKQDWRHDPQRVIIQVFLATATIAGTVGTLFGYFLLGSGSGH